VDEVYRDPQVVHRKYFREVAHPTQPEGTTWIESHRPHLSRTPAEFERGGPTYGQDTEHVLYDLLGYTEDEVIELAVLGALE
jgi:crotonobetainyl-CoA:carnitine CoA-transferase CaiB-like acyl-CoA transferase